MDGKSNTNLIVKNNDDEFDSIFNDSLTKVSLSSYFSSSEMDDDDVEASSSSSTSSLSSLSSSNFNGPLYELSELMNHLPIKRGLSMFYQGKAQSFGSLARVESIEDLPKKEKPKRLCKSFGLCNPKATIAKKSSRRSCLSIIISKRKKFLGE